MISVEMSDNKLLMFNLKDFEHELIFLGILEKACKEKAKKLFKVREEEKLFEIHSENVTAFYFEKRRYRHAVGEQIESFLSSL
jgi:hypothetical protein